MYECLCSGNQQQLYNQCLYKYICSSIVDMSIWYIDCHMGLWPSGVNMNILVNWYNLLFYTHLYKFVCDRSNFTLLFLITRRNVPGTTQHWAIIVNCLAQGNNRGLDRVQTYADRRSSDYMIEALITFVLITCLRKNY